MSGYTKLFGSILASTVWELPLATKVVWITMLAMADRDGEVQASIPGLAKFAGVTVAACEEALEAFLSPDRYSRTREHEGRRIEAIDGGWKLLTYAKHRALMSADIQRERATERKRIYRVGQKRDNTGHFATVPVSPHIAEADPKADTDKTRSQNGLLASLGESVYPADFDLVWIGTGRRGTKFKAFKAWQKNGKPSWNALESRWTAYLASERPVAGFVQDLSSWLNGKGHTQDWEPASRARLGRAATSYEQTMESFKGFLERHEGDD